MLGSIVKLCPRRLSSIQIVPSASLCSVRDRILVTGCFTKTEVDEALNSGRVRLNGTKLSKDSQVLKNEQFMFRGQDIAPMPDVPPLYVLRKPLKTVCSNEGLADLMLHRRNEICSTQGHKADRIDDQFDSYSLPKYFHIVHSMPASMSGLVLLTTCPTYAKVIASTTSVMIRSKVSIVGRRLDDGKSLALSNPQSSLDSGSFRNVFDKLNRDVRNAVAESAKTKLGVSVVFTARGGSADESGVLEVRISNFADSSLKTVVEFLNVRFGSKTGCQMGNMRLTRIGSLAVEDVHPHQLARAAHDREWIRAFEKHTRERGDGSSPGRMIARKLASVKLAT